MELQPYVGIAARLFEAAGVLVMLVGSLLAPVLAYRARRRGHAESAYRVIRQKVGASILLGLELLVAADIIRTVAESPTFQHVAVLGLIVLIRTFLSFTLNVELEGRWPWQRGHPERSSAHPPAPPSAPGSRPPTGSTPPVTSSRPEDEVRAH